MQNLHEDNDKVTNDALSSSGGIAAGAVAVGAVAAMSYSPEAHAVCGDVQAKFEKKLAEAIKKPFEDAVYSLFEGVTQSFDMLSASSISVISSSMTSSTDAQNTVKQKLANDRLKRAAEPPADGEEADRSAKQIYASFNAQDERAGAYSASVHKQAHSESYQVAGSYFDSLELDLNSRALKPYLIFSGPSSENMMDEATLSRSINLTVGFGKTNEESAMFYRNHGDGTRDINGYSAAQSLASLVSRQQVATQGLAEAFAMRGNKENPSYLDALGSELNRTYQSKEWRQKVRSHADPTPNSLQLALTMASNNQAQLALLEKEKTLNSVLGVKLMTLLDMGAQNGW